VPPILVGLDLGSAEVRLVVGFGVVILSVAENYPGNCGDPERWSRLIRLNPSGNPCQGWVVGLSKAR
jgi:hypothetical protein